jgi:murein DD-endopeptidase MepM/ murein hydrolase activator NlpD
MRRPLLVPAAVLVAAGAMLTATATSAPAALTVAAPSAAATAPSSAAPAVTPANQRAAPAVIRPLIAVAPVAGQVQRPFEQPDGPYGRGHRGADLVARRSERVRAAMPGTVRFAGPVAGELWITVTHADGLETTYGGVSSTVEVGERVAIGQPIGRVRVGRRHLDWGARLHGAYVDPLGLLTGWRVRLVAPSVGR